jgi:hypothetical protein
MEKLDKKLVSVEYKKTSDYKIVPATGAYGGPTPQGEILCNFYIEYQLPPDSIELEINPIKGTSKEIDKVAKGSYARELNTGVLMRPDIAKTIGEWLIQQANAVLENMPKLDS